MEASSYALHTYDGSAMNESFRVNTDGTVTLGSIDSNSDATLHVRSPNGAETTRLEL